MGPLGRLRSLLFGRPKLSGAQGARMAAWRALAPADLGLPHKRARYVVVDTETTGLDLRRDRVIAIGAMALTGGCISLSECFEAVLRQDQPSPDQNVLIHRIGGQTQLHGVERADGMVAFLAHIDNSPLVAFRAEFDRTMLEREARAVLGLGLHRPWIDLAFLLPALFPNTQCASLDHWIAHFSLGGGERHHAIADAFACAQLLQIALAVAERDGMRSARDLLAVQKAQQWLGKRY